MKTIFISCLLAVSVLASEEIKTCYYQNNSNSGMEDSNQNYMIACIIKYLDEKK